MRTSLLFLIPLYSVMISLITLMVSAWYLKTQKKEFLEQISSKVLGKFDSGFLNLEAEQEIESQIDERLDHIILGFKTQIPMVGMFLSKPKEEELKQLAKTELMRLVPNLKQRIVQKANEVFNHSKEEKMGIQINELMEQLCRHVKCRLILVVCGVGLLLGLIELELIHLLIK